MTPSWLGVDNLVAGAKHDCGSVIRRALYCQKVPLPIIPHHYAGRFLQTDDMAYHTVRGKRAIQGMRSDAPCIGTKFRATGAPDFDRNTPLV